MLTKSENGGRFSQLSSREREVIGLAAAGLLDKEIGANLDISLNTLRTYWNRIREKVGDEPRTALVAAYVTEELKQDLGIKFDPRVHEGWVMDAKTRMVLATDGVNRLHNLELGVPHHASCYLGCTHPEDGEKVMALVMEVADGKRDAVHLVFRLVLPHGIELVNTTVHSVKDENGEVTKVYGFRVQTLDCRPGRNPTVRVAHWEESDYESETFEVDDEFACIFGLPHAGTVHRGEINWDRHPDDAERARKACLEAVADRKEHLVTDVRLVLGDGSTVWGRARRRFVYQGDGRVRIFGTFTVFE